MGEAVQVIGSDDGAPGLYEEHQFHVKILVSLSDTALNGFVSHLAVVG